MIGRPLSRRDLWKLLVGFAGYGLARSRGVDAAPYDQGIGGTGAAPSEPEEGDRGIGGTGVVGTIRKFGSIYVNDLRIAYPATVAVRVDGAPARVSDLKIGQVVRVVARDQNGAYSTGAIDVSSEAAGVIEAVSAHTIKVLGQTVVLDGLAADDRRWKVGNSVAVYGLRRPDGAIVASLISAKPAGLARVVGPVRQGENGVLTIGGLALRGLDPSLVGQRAVVTGQMASHALDVVSQGTETAFLTRSGARSFLIEAYVSRRDGGLELGSGLHVVGAATDAPATGAVRAIVHASIGAHGTFRLEALRPIAGLGEMRGQNHGRGGGPDGRGGPPHQNRGGLFRGRFRSLQHRFGNFFRRGPSGPRGFPMRRPERGPFGGGGLGGGPGGLGGGFGGLGGGRR